MSDLYVCHTPLHVLLAVGRARPDSRLVIVGEFGGLRYIAHALGGWMGSPFADVAFLEGGSVLNRSRSAWRLRFASLPTPERIYVTNDYLPEDQAVLRRFPKARAFYLDDGVASYGSHSFGFGQEPWRQLARLVLFGPWYRYLDVLGTHPSLAGSVLMFPEHARPEVRRPVEGYDFLQMKRGPAATFVRRWFSAWEHENGPLPEIVSLLLLDHSEQKRPGYTEAVRRICEETRSLAVKHHPREKVADPFGIANTGVRVLPAELPAEYLYLRFPKLESVSGGATTALMTAKALLPKAEVRAIGVRDPQLRQVFDEMGITDESRQGATS